ncbi:MAG TPA: hypothetical protein VEY51_10830 [Chondromyces sp.]|nr:hypothetical protein [Chondromyces sp.]
MKKGRPEKMGTRKRPVSERELHQKREAAIWLPSPCRRKSDQGERERGR